MCTFLANLSYIIQCYQQQSAHFVLDAQNLFILQLKACAILLTSPYFSHPPPAPDNKFLLSVSISLT